MLEMDVGVVKGFTVIRLDGDLTNKTFKRLNEEIDYLLYKQGMHFFIFDFNRVKNTDAVTYGYFQKKLIEIFLSCGKVILCGIKDVFRNIKDSSRLFYVNDCFEALNCFNI
ncbi:MAG: STAS domain-containing protein [Tenericutes bacterium]|nr:STAS domain-containing protein [Mycoplasmatota bacterium]